MGQVTSPAQATSQCGRGGIQIEVASHDAATPRPLSSGERCIEPVKLLTPTRSRLRSPISTTAFASATACRPTTIEALERVDGLSEEFGNLATVRANGVVDASCALIARVVLSIVPRYAIGLLTRSDHLTPGTRRG